MKNSKRLWDVSLVVLLLYSFHVKTTKLKKVEEVSYNEEVDSMSTAFMF
jgi:hypothetical protein